MTTEDAPPEDEAKTTTETTTTETKPTTTGNSNHKAIARFEEMKKEGATLDKLKAFVTSSITQRERDPSKALISSTREVQLLITALLNYGMEKENLSVLFFA